ncbi:hypothetical protein ACLKMH_21930 [Psychromonas sp. KJ10-10]
MLDDELICVGSLDVT